jgi:hypothetical protein
MAIRGLETGKNFIVFQHPLLIIFVPVVLGLYSCLVKNAQTLLLLRCHWTSKSSSAATVKKLQSFIPVSAFFRPIVNSTASSNAPSVKAPPIEIGEEALSQQVFSKFI